MFLSSIFSYLLFFSSSLLFSLEVQLNPFHGSPHLQIKFKFFSNIMFIYRSLLLSNLSCYSSPFKGTFTPVTSNTALPEKWHASLLFFCTHHFFCRKAFSFLIYLTCSPFKIQFKGSVPLLRLNALLAKKLSFNACIFSKKKE